MRFTGRRPSFATGDSISYNIKTRSITVSAKKGHKSKNFLVQRYRSRKRHSYKYNKVEVQTSRIPGSPRPEPISQCYNPKKAKEELDTRSQPPLSTGRRSQEEAFKSDVRPSRNGQHSRSCCTGTDESGQDGGERTADLGLSCADGVLDGQPLSPRESTIRRE